VTWAVPVSPEGTVEIGSTPLAIARETYLVQVPHYTTATQIRVPTAKKSKASYIDDASLRALLFDINVSLVWEDDVCWDLISIRSKLSHPYSRPLSNVRYFILPSEKSTSPKSTVVEYSVVMICSATTE
jgi:hypothetical protein